MNNVGYELLESDVDDFKKILKKINISEELIKKLFACEKKSVKIKKEIKPAVQNKNVDLTKIEDISELKQIILKTVKEIHELIDKL